MTTLYTTSQGTTTMPVEVELYSSEGARLGFIGAFDEVKVTWADRAPDTASMILPLTELTSRLLAVDGSVLIVARVGGITHVSTPVEAHATGDEDAPGAPRVHVTSAGGWALFSASRIPPSLEDPISQTTGEGYRLEGALDAVVKRLVTLAATRLGLPIIVAPPTNSGPRVTLTGAWETVGEVLESALTGTGYRVAITSWAPGDPAPGWATPTVPCIFVDVVPYRPRPGLVWSVEAGDLTKWDLTATRAKATRVTVGYATDEQSTRRYQEFRREDGVSPWGRREEYVKYDYKAPEWQDSDVAPDMYRVAEGMEAAGDEALMTGAATTSLDADVEVSSLWTFARGSEAPRTFDVGDLAEVDLPYLGPFTRAITAVEVRVTPTEYAVKPTVSTPDTIDRDLYTDLAQLGRRVSNLER